MNLFSVVIPCFNEEKTLETCIHRVLDLSTPDLDLEIILVDDGSTDNSLAIAKALQEKHPQIRLVGHDRNQGKGAALRTGFKAVRGDWIAVQDADLEYDPGELVKLIAPLAEGSADVVLGSRFLSTEPGQVPYFRQALGNRFLTFLSNLFTDLKLTDMETCYKVFRREVIQNVKIRESGFGVEPELIAKLARLRICELAISYRGRTYAEGKKVGVKDGFRAIFCILKYNAHRAPLPVQLSLYLTIGGFAAMVNLLGFLALFHSGAGALISAAAASVIAAAVYYVLCGRILFRHRATRSSLMEIAVFFSVVAGGCLVDAQTTQLMIAAGWAPSLSKLCAGALSLLLNVAGRRFIVFPFRL